MLLLRKVREINFDGHLPPKLTREHVQPDVGDPFPWENGEEVAVGVLVSSSQFWFRYQHLPFLKTSKTTFFISHHALILVGLKICRVGPLQPYLNSALLVAILRAKSCLESLKFTVITILLQGYPKSIMIIIYKMQFLPQSEVFQFLPFLLVSQQYLSCCQSDAQVCLLAQCLG